jgi:hypothetical protein
MLVQAIDGAVSRGISRSRHSPWRATLLDAGLNFARQYAGFRHVLSQRSRGRIRWLELENKIAAYRLFQGRDLSGRRLDQEAISQLDPHSRLFAAEGQAYRTSRSNCLSAEAISELGPIAIHAGAGLHRAEQALEYIVAGGRESEVLAEFADACRREAWEGFGGIMEEALGLAARTLYPHLVDRLDVCLRATNAVFWQRFWHGVGRGIYFAPTNIPAFRAVPWSGVGMCLKEPPHETGKQNALSGFCFALTLVNLKSPEVLQAFLKDHAQQFNDCVDGAQAALSVWTLSCGSSETAEHLAANYSEELRERSPASRLSPYCAAGQENSQPERFFYARRLAQ